MSSSAARAGVLIVLAAVAVALFVVLSDSDDSDDGTTTSAGGDQTEVTTPAEPSVQTIQIKDGAPLGGARKLVYQKGERIRIVVQLDEPQEDVHIHGYEEEVLNPQRVARFDFPANLDGGFELEAHGPSGDVLLAEIIVNPG